MAARITASGSQPRTMPGAVFGDFIAEEVRRPGDLVRMAGIRADRWGLGPFGPSGSRAEPWILYANRRSAAAGRKRSVKNRSGVGMSPRL